MQFDHDLHRINSNGTLLKTRKTFDEQLYAQIQWRSGKRNVKVHWRVKQEERPRSGIVKVINLWKKSSLIKSEDN